MCILCNKPIFHTVSIFLLRKFIKFSLSSCKLEVTMDLWEPKLNLLVEAFSLYPPLPDFIKINSVVLEVKHAGRWTET